MEPVNDGEPVTWRDLRLAVEEMAIGQQAQAEIFAEALAIAMELGGIDPLHLQAALMPRVEALTGGAETLAQLAGEQGRAAELRGNALRRACAIVLREAFPVD